MKKRFLTWLAVIAVITFIIAWGVMGLKIADGRYDITAEAYIGLVCIIVFTISVLFIRFSDKCPHCGKRRESRGKYCHHCGKEID